MSGDSSSRLVWFLTGTAIGAALALLYAPRTGRDTRREIGKRTEAGREALAGSGKEILDQGKELYDKGRKIADEAADMFDRGRKLVQG